MGLDGGWSLLLALKMVVASCVGRLRTSLQRDSTVSRSSGPVLLTPVLTARLFPSSALPCLSSQNT